MLFFHLEPNLVVQYSFHSRACLTESCTSSQATFLSLDLSDQSHALFISVIFADAGGEALGTATSASTVITIVGKRHRRGCVARGIVVVHTISSVCASTVGCVVALAAFVRVRGLATHGWW